MLDLVAQGVSAIVFCAGFGSDFSWVKPPVLDERGFPLHERGVTGIEGLYFIGLPWLHTWGSGRFSGVGRDASYIVERITDLPAAPAGTTESELTEPYSATA
jgi:putative flavoprotein involved in K+ transport